MALVSAAEYARIRSVSKEAVSKAIRTGRITTIDGDNGRKLIDVDAANVAWAARTDSTQQHRGSAKDFERTQTLARDSAAGKTNESKPPARDLGLGLSLIEEKTRSERLRIERQEMELAQMRGETISRAAVEAAWSTKLIAAAEQFQGIPDRLSAVLAAETSAEVVHRKLSEETRNAMTMLAIGQTVPH